jgi:hypothetical protein
MSFGGFSYGFDSGAGTPHSQPPLAQTQDDEEEGEDDDE